MNILWEVDSTHKARISWVTLFGKQRAIEEMTINQKHQDCFRSNFLSISFGGSMTPLIHVCLWNDQASSFFLSRRFLIWQIAYSIINRYKPAIRSTLFNFYLEKYSSKYANVFSIFTVRYFPTTNGATLTFNSFKKSFKGQIDNEMTILKYFINYSRFKTWIFVTGEYFTVGTGAVNSINRPLHTRTDRRYYWTEGNDHYSSI